MDYLKVPELNHALMMLPVSPNDCNTPLPSRRRFFANLINAVYTPTTGLLAQLEDQKRVIEELRGEVEAMLQKCPNVECCHCSAVICPHKDPLHFHHDGCPSCD